MGILHRRGEGNGPVSFGGIVIFYNLFFSKECPESFLSGIVVLCGDIVCFFSIIGNIDFHKAHHKMEDEVIGEGIVFMFLYFIDFLPVIFHIFVGECHVERDICHIPGEDGCIMIESFVDAFAVV